MLIRTYSYCTSTAWGPRGRRRRRGSRRRPRARRQRKRPPAVVGPGADGAGPRKVPAPARSAPMAATGAVGRTRPAPLHSMWVAPSRMQGQVASDGSRPRRSATDSSGDGHILGSRCAGCRPRAPRRPGRPWPRRRATRPSPLWARPRPPCRRRIPASGRRRPRSRVPCPYAVIALPRILTSAIEIPGDNRLLLPTVRGAAPYTNIRHAIYPT